MSRRNVSLVVFSVDVFAPTIFDISKLRLLSLLTLEKVKPL